MPTTPINIVSHRKAVKYTGANSADIDGMITNFDITSESGGVLHFDSNSSSFTVNTNEWIVFYQGAAEEVHTQTSFDGFFACNTLCADTAGFASGVQVRAVGVATVPLLLVGGSATVAVTLQPAMPDSTYNAYASKFAGVSLTDLSINSVTVVNSTTVNVAVSNTGLATITGASVMVHALD